MTETETGTETEGGTEGGTETETETETQTRSDIGPEVQTGAGTEPETQTGADTGAETETDDLVFFMELDGLGDAHFIGSSLDTAGIPYRIAKHRSHAFDIAIAHGWGMLYVAHEDFEKVKEIVTQVREDESSMRDMDDEESDTETEGAEEA